MYHIPYAQPLYVLQPVQREVFRAQLNLQPDGLALLFASQSLATTRKGGIYLVHLLQVLAKSSLKECITVFILEGNTATEFTNGGIRVQCLGHIDNRQQMAVSYNAAASVLIPSLEDNQPNVIFEALDCGTSVVAFNNDAIV